MIAPHGGRLAPLAAAGEAANELRERARGLPGLVLSARQLNDLELFGNGALSPLDGFMCKADYDCVVQSMRLESGLLWSIPITLALGAPEDLSEGSHVSLLDACGTIRGTLDVRERFRVDRAAEARNVYGTDDPAHPGVAALFAEGDVLLGGPVSVLPVAPESPRRLSPTETRAAFERRGWKSIVGFQTRNPVHRAHEYIQKCALETIDGLLLHPLVGETKSDDIPAEVRMRCYEVLLEKYYPADRVLLAELPASMRYAGPREAVFHALLRKNYGCTHFIVGRDHAGVGNYYGTYDAQRIMDTIPPADLGIVPLKFENSFFCRRCEVMASERTCPHPVETRVSLSGTALRAMLAAGEIPPPEFTRPEVAQILIAAARRDAAA